MYLERLNLKYHPFAITPDLDLLFWSDPHWSAFETIRSRLGKGGTVTLFVGPVGAGKTLLIHALVDDESIKRRCKVLLVSNMFGDTPEILQRLLYAMGGAANDVDAMWRELKAGLDRIRRSGLEPIIMADEAQTLSTEGAEVLARIAGEPEFGGVPMLIAGQSELESMMKTSGYRQLGSLVGKTVSLSGLSLEDTGEYIRARLAGADANKNPFEAGTVEIIHNRTKGIPRLVNKACDALLMLCSQADLETVDPGSAQQFFREYLDPVSFALTQLPEKIDDTAARAIEDPPPKREPLHEPVNRGGGTVDERATELATSPALSVAGHLSDVSQRRSPWSLISVAASVATIAFLAGLTGQDLFRNWLADDFETAEIAALTARKQAIEGQIAEAEAELTKALNAEQALAAQMQSMRGDLESIEGAVADARQQLTEVEAQTANMTALSMQKSLAAPESDVVFKAALAREASADIPVTLQLSGQNLSASLFSPLATEPSAQANSFYEGALGESEARRAAVLYARAALGGHRQAARYLGQLFETGDGVAFAPSVAQTWYRLADRQKPMPDSVAGDPGSLASPLFSTVSGENLDLVWDGDGASYLVEFADSERQIIGWFKTRLAAARLVKPQAADAWRVSIPASVMRSAWTPLEYAPDE